MAIVLSLVAVLALLIAAGCVIYAYLPWRKRILIALDPRWRRDARLLSFTPEEEARAAANPLLARVLVRDACDVIWNEDEDVPAILFGELPHGTLVHVNARNVPRFMDEVLPELKSPIVLHSGFDTVTTRYPGFERIIQSPLVLHWYLEHFELDPEHLSRVTPLPIGLDFHKLTPSAGANRGYDMGLPASPENQQLTLEAIRDSIPSIAERPLKAYANFHLSMDTFLRSPEARKRRPARLEAMRILKGKEHTFFEPRQRTRHAVWARHREFAFELSPRGNGIDCHRTWESLILKTIPIVQTSKLDPIYRDLPVAIVKDWNEVTPERLKLWREQFCVSIDGPMSEKLYASYWIGAMRAHAHSRD
jgi:hypothetical protein